MGEGRHARPPGGKTGASRAPAFSWTQVIAWFERYRNVTPKQFEAFLREIYSRPDMLKRFPLGF
jgi:hypothetical protein